MIVSFTWWVINRVDDGAAPVAEVAADVEVCVAADVEVNVAADVAADRSPVAWLHMWHQKGNQTTTKPQVKWSFTSLNQMSPSLLPACSIIGLSDLNW